MPLDTSDPEHPKPGKPELFLRSPLETQEPAFSPDGRWIAYASAESGRSEVFVRRFSAGGQSGSGKWLVSTGGGHLPIWSRDGTELFYRSGSRIMSVAHHPLSASGTFGTPQVLFTGAFDFSQDRNWSLSPDGSFIMIKADPTMGRQLRVVFNWFDEVTGAAKGR